MAPLDPDRCLKRTVNPFVGSSSLPPGAEEPLYHKGFRALGAMGHHRRRFVVLENPVKGMVLRCLSGLVRMV